jgi:methanogenic corrinoid protein MtbC1
VTTEQIDATSLIRETNAADIRDALWAAALDGDEIAGVKCVFDAIDAGMSVESALLDVIAAVQARVGSEWAGARLTVAQEHAATAINDRVIAALGHHPAARTTGSRGRITVACVDGEWHALPARLLTEVLRLHGWHVDFLGAHVPTRHLITHLHQRGPIAVALSSSIATRLPTAHAAITACQAIGVPVLAGGAAFGPDGRHARRLGADAWAPDARTAVQLLLSGLPAHVGVTAHQPLDDLPHLSDQEYTMVSSTTPQLARTVLTELEERFPAMRGYSAHQLERTAEDILHIIEFLGTALYIDDDQLFSDFITWTADILTARAVPAASLLVTLDLLAGQLKDFPRALRMLDSACGPALSGRVGCGG